jgi:hypothetical protein
MNASEIIERRLRELAPEADLTYTHLAITIDQISELDLSTRPTSTTDTRAEGFR